MSTSYPAIDWNRQKRLYDLTLASLLALGFATFAGASWMVSPGMTVETVIIRACAVSALALLHVILCVGPLARLDPRFLPWLYNRRHLGVTMFLLAAVHGLFSLVQFHALGDENPLVSVFTAYRSDYRVVANGGVNLAHFPFEPFGVVALLILFVMAATIHDFWLRNLGAWFWKSIHLGVYVAYGLLLSHVALGALQSERSVLYPFPLGLGLVVVVGLHLAAARKEARADTLRPQAGDDGFIDVCNVAEVIEGRGKVVLIGELVDTKCYFGVMRPATGKVHRACAVRCLSGGVPPGLLIRDSQDGARVILLTGAGGTPLRFDVQWAARSIVASGRLFSNEGTPHLEVKTLALLDERNH